MISKWHRFHGHSSLNFVYRHGVVTRDHQISLRTVRNGRRTTYRVAVIVSRKVHKSAVRRNRIRRRIYETIRLNGGGINEPYDMVFTVFSDQLADMPSDKLQALVSRLLSKSGVVNMAPLQPGAGSHDIVTRKED
jgi:ribonuclease P protein component